MIKQYDTFCVSIPDEETGKKAIVFHILGYDKSKIDNIYIAVSKMLNTMKSRGDFIYEDEKDFIGMIVDEAWKRHICLEDDYPTYGTFNLVD